MHKLNKIIFAICSVFIMCNMSSCEKKWLEEKSEKALAVPSTLKDFQEILDFYLTMMNRDNPALLGNLSADGYYTTDAAFTAATSDNMINAYTWSYGRPYSSESVWDIPYQRIFRCNVVLDGLKILVSDQRELQERNNIEGQALFHRAFAFFSLSQIWAPPYEPSTANTDLSIPLKLESDVTIPSSRSTVRQTYDQIIGDLLRAKQLLPHTSSFVTRPSKLIAYALLARIYLSMREYEKAGIYADSCLKINNNLMDYSKLNIPTNQNFIGDVRQISEVLFYMDMSGAVYNFLTTNYFVDVSIYNSYNNNDLRKSIFFRVNTNGTISFKGNYNNTASNLFCGLATDELYLIRAESYARSGNTNLAMKDLNDLLRSRWKKESGVTSYVDQNVSTSKEALVLILMERKKELILRGLRWSDLRRLNFEDEYKTTLKRVIEGQNYSLEPGSYRYTFPIPDAIIAISGMKQNPGW